MSASLIFADGYDEACVDTRLQPAEAAWTHIKNHRRLLMGMVQKLAAANRLLKGL